MFYAHFVLAKKGPLARIWLAAHWDKKLTKAHVFETNIDDSVKDIMSPKVKMALRTSGHLLLGVVRIYSRKAKYLLADCNEAFVKIKMAFRPGMVDLPEDNREAAMNAITLPEVFHDFDTAMPDIGEQTFQDQFKMNQTRAEEITMREDYGNIALDAGGADDGFGEQIGSPEMLRDPTDHEGGGDEYSGIQGSFSRAASTYGAPTHSLLLGQSHSMILGEQSVAGSIMGRGESLAPSRAGSIRPTSPGAHSLAGSIRPPSPCASIRSRADSIRPPSVSAAGSYVHPLRQDLDAPIQDDGFGGSMTGTGQDILAGGLFEDGSLFDEAPPSMPASAMSERGAPSVSDYNDLGPDQFGGPPSPGPSSGGSRGPSPIPPGSPTPSHRSEASHRSGASLAPSTKSQASLAASQTSTARSLRSTRSEAHSEAGEEPSEEPEIETTTLIHNEEESFALAPVEASALKGLTRTKRKRKLIVDDVKAISGEEMKGQLSDTGDIVTTLDLAPPTKRLMHWKETGGVEKLFALPGRMLQSRHIHDDYSCNLIVRPSTLETFGELLGASQDEPDLDLEKVPGTSEFQEPLPPASKRGRKRKNVEPEAPVESAYSKKQTELAAAVEEDARLEREKQEAAREDREAVREDRVDEDREAARERDERERERHTSGPALDLTGLDPGTPLVRDRAEVDINTPAQEMNTPCQPGQTPLQTPVQGDFFSQQQTPQGSLGGRDQTFPDQTPGHDSYYGGGGATPAYSDYNGGGQTPAYNGVEVPTGGPQYPPTATPQYPSTETPQYPPTDTPQYPPTDTPQYPPTGTPQYPTTDTPQYPPNDTPQYPPENTPHYHPPSSPPPPASPFPTPAHGLATPHLQHMEEDSPHHPAPGLPQGPQQDFTDQWVSQAATAQATGAALRPPCTPSHETDWDNNRPPSGASGRISPMEEDEEEEEEEDDNEYLDEETVEQFEDRVLNKRAAQLHCRLRQRMMEDPVLAFSTITRRKDTKKVACQKFYSLLVLQKYCAVDLKQDEVGFGEMEVRRGPQFDLDTGKVKRKA